MEIASVRGNVKNLRHIERVKNAKSIPEQKAVVHFYMNVDGSLPRGYQKELCIIFSDQTKKSLIKQ